METHAPTQEIGAVLSRFQVWTGAQSAAKLKNGVRELSYEEAIGRKRRTATRAPVEPVKAISKKMVSKEPERKADAAKKKAAARPETVSRKRHGDFRAALEERVSSVAIVPAREAAAGRSLTISIRISEQEQAFFKARAEAENLTVSGYLRHCALEVERLRLQLRQAENRLYLPSVSQSKRGFFERFSALFRHRKSLQTGLRA